MRRNIVKYVAINLLLVVFLAVGLNTIHARSAAPQRLQPGQMWQGQVDPTNVEEFFIFGGSPDMATLLFIHSTGQELGPSITLENATTGDVIAVLNENVTGSCLRLQPGTTTYLLKVSQPTEAVTMPYAMILEPIEPDNLNCPESADFPIVEAIAPLTSAANCDVLPMGTMNVNMRQQPDISAPVVGSVSTDQPGTVLGVLANGAWLTVTNGSTSGWVATPVVQSAGDCTRIPIIASSDATISTVSTLSGTGSGLPGSVPVSIDGGPTVIDISDVIGDPDLLELAGITLNASGTAAEQSEDATITTGGNTLNIDLGADADNGTGWIDIQDQDGSSIIGADNSGAGGDVVDTVNDTVDDVVDDIDLGGDDDDDGGLLGGLLGG